MRVLRENPREGWELLDAVTRPAAPAAPVSSGPCEQLVLPGLAA
jgi:hypothetical protein